MVLKSYTVGPFSQNTYLLSQKGEGLLIDPGFYDPTEYVQFKSDIKENKIKLLAVLLTHAHIDHVIGLDKVLADFNIPVYLNHSDLYLWNNFPNQAAMFGVRTAGFDFIPEPLPEMNGMKLGSFQFDVLYTPGHSPDHVSLYFKEKNLLIAGDVLFKQSIGRTDLYKGDFDILATSIRQKLYVLPNSTEVWPGHGPKTTIGFEKENNGFVKG
tara:strand:- start:21841 stop:22476 length:636 start_codon:yes stop_codon:yes gene_type:complete